MRLIALSLLLAAAACSISAAVAAGDAPRRKGPARAEKPKKFEPYHADRARPASRPGFVDVGGGTEVRITGRTRFESQYMR